MHSARRYSRAIPIRLRCPLIIDSLRQAGSWMRAGGHHDGARCQARSSGVRSGCRFPIDSWRSGACTPGRECRKLGLLHPQWRSGHAFARSAWRCVRHCDDPHPSDGRIQSCRRNLRHASELAMERCVLVLGTPIDRHQHPVAGTIVAPRRAEYHYEANAGRSARGAFSDLVDLNRPGKVGASKNPGRFTRPHPLRTADDSDRPKQLVVVRRDPPRSYLQPGAAG